MLGRAVCRVAACRCWATALHKRGISEATHAAPPPAISDEFIKKWKEVAPNLDLPKFPSQFMQPRPPVPATIPDKVTVNLVLPHEVEMEAQRVDMVMLPATTGQMGVLPGHVPTIAELKPGVLSIHEDGKVKKQYFVSSGFAFVHANSVTDVVAVEAVSLDNFDPEEVKKGLAEWTQKSNTATTDLERAQAQIGVEVHSALSSALGV